MSMNQLRAFSFGGGVQSTACLVLAVQGRIDYPVFLFCNVGDDSENPKTLAYVEEHARPYAEAHGVELHTIQKLRRNGEPETLLGRLNRVQRSIDIPVRMRSGAPGNRKCTPDFKIKVVAGWLKARGATEEVPALIGLGISVDEIGRANVSRIPHVVNAHPLLDLGMNRADCRSIIAGAGLPVPPKSACWFCPMRKPSAWGEMAREDPEHFTAAAELEAMLNRRRGELGKDPVWLTRFNAPLTNLFGQVQEAFDLGEDPDGCESGYCWT
jgi:hypothetical protein